jgi:hypothetical protein
MSRLENLKHQNKDLNINLIDLLAQADPSDSYKYLPFLIKMFKSNFTTNGDILRHLFTREHLFNLHKFEEHSKANRIKNKDIGMYTSFKQIESEVKSADEIVRLKELEKQVKKIYESDQWLVLIPLSYESAKMYGANTKWCVTQERYWNQYISEYKIVYIINKTDDSKFAISSKNNGKLVEGWLADDSAVSPFMIPIPSELLAIITDEIRDTESIDSMQEYLNLHKRSAMLEKSRYPDDRYLGTLYERQSISEYSHVDLNQYRTWAEDSLDAEHILQIMNKLGMSNLNGD